MYNTIIVSTDFSDQESTIQSIKHAKELSSNDRVILLHVLELIPSYALEQLSDDLIADVHPKSHELMKRLSDRAGADTKIEIRNGSAYRQIIKSAEENNAGLIFINSHRPGFQDYLLGSTAAKVVRHAKCPVLVQR